MWLKRKNGRKSDEEERSELSTITYRSTPGSVTKILKLNKIEYRPNSYRGKTCKSSACFLVKKRLCSNYLVNFVELKIFCNRTRKIKHRGMMWEERRIRLLPLNTCSATFHSRRHMPRLKSLTNELYACQPNVPVSTYIG
jgi:hypothetical protein